MSMLQSKSHMSFFGPQPSASDEETLERPPEAAALSLPSAGPPSEAFTAGQPSPPAPSRVWRRARRIGWELTQTLFLAAVIFFAVRAAAQNFRVEGASMEPGLHNGQYLLVNKAVYAKINLQTLAKYVPFLDAGDHPQRFLFRSPKRGDVVVFRFPRDPDRDFIKRVIAVPGDTVEVVDGAVFVNGKQLADDYITNPGKYDTPKQVVPNGQYFVLGDNRGSSYDSHEWGFVPEDNIIGQAMVSYWPLSEFGGVGNHSIDLGFFRLPLP